MRSIMVVEDENLVSLHIRKTLEFKGYDVTAVATSGEEAVIKAGETHPDLVLMDIMLKGEMDGIEAAGKIRETMDIPIIYLTAYADNETLDRAKSTGAHGYIVKPFKEQDLYSSVEVALVKYQMEQRVKESEERYKKLLKSITDYIYTVEIKDGLPISSKHGIACVSVTGYSPEEFDSNENLWYEMIYEDDRGEVEEAMSKVLLGEEVPLIEHRITRKDGHICWIRNTLVPRFDEEGHMVAYDGLIKDITERKHAERAVKLERDKLTGILEAMEDGVYIVSQKYDIEYINPVIRKEFGPVRRRKCYKYFHDRTEACSWCKNEEVFKGKSVQWEWYSPQNKKYYDLFDTPIKNEDDSISKLEIFHDVTERKKAEEARKESEERIARLNECFLNFGHDSAENINSLTALCGELLGATCALYNRLEKGMLFSAGQWCAPPDYNPLDRPEGHICYDVLMGRDEEVLIVRELQNSRYAETDPNVIPYKLQTYMGHSVKAKNFCIGSLCVVYQHDFEPSEEDKRLLGIIASAISVEEERSMAEVEVRSSQARLEHLLISSPTVIYSCKVEDKRFIPSFVSENIKKLFGYDQKDFLDNPDWWVNNIHPDDRDGIVKEFTEAVYSGGPIYTHEYRFKQKDGTYCWVHDELNLLRDEKGRPLEIVGSWTDVTGRREAEQEVRFLSEVTENMSEGVMLARQSDLTITYTNKKFEKMFGYDQGELIGKPVSVLNVSVDETPGETSNEIVQCLKEKAAWEGEIRNITKEGKLFWSHASITPFKHDTYGTIWISVQTDITERKELKNELERNVEALANSNKTWVDTFNAISDPVFTCDKELRIIKANRAYQEEAGLLFRELAGKKYWEVFPRMDGPFDCCEIPDQEPCSWEDRDFVDAASKKVFRVRLFSITGLEGEPDYFLFTLEDVTELKRAQEMLMQSAKLASIGELGSNIAHEINNPMTAVLGYTSYILEGIGEDSPYYEDLKAVEGEALRVRGIVRNLLDFAKQRKLRKEKADINMVLSEALTLVNHMAEIAHIKLEQEIGEEMPDIMIDVNQIKQVFVNLVNNACHAMEGGGPTDEDRGEKI